MPMFVNTEILLAFSIPLPDRLLSLLLFLFSWTKPQACAQLTTNIQHIHTASYLYCVAHHTHTSTLSVVMCEGFATSLYYSAKTVSFLTCTIRPKKTPKYMCCKTDTTQHHQHHHRFNAGFAQQSTGESRTIAL